MSEYEEFLQALTKNEDDTALRLVFADWLDERGEHEEADRQRKWPAAKEWFVRFCHKNNPPPEADPELHRIFPEQLIEMGQEAIRGILSRGQYSMPEQSLRQMLVCGWDVLERTRLVEPSENWRFSFYFGNNEQMLYSVAENIHEFWRNWSIVTGVPLPPDVEGKSRFSCGC